MLNALGGAPCATLFGRGGYFLGQAFEHSARPVGVTALIAAVIGAIGASRFIARHESLLRAEAELPGALAALGGKPGARYFQIPSHSEHAKMLQKPQVSRERAI